MSTELSKSYQPRLIEERWARFWVEQRLFTPEVAAELRPPDKGTFSLAIPPPNVTGSLHMGHMLEHTQIDILMRWRRMQGYRVLWLPGTDHAGISTQVVVERQLVAEGTSREKLGREAFESRVWRWKEQSGGAILHQMRRIGDSVDWSREAFTMDAPRYRAVLEAFLRLYNEGLIYRGRYLVNWCPRCRTALSDLETPKEERNGHLWHVRYPLADGGGYVVVATTRPETMLGDTAVAVHPDDERFAALVGKRVRLPLMNREIPIIADAAVERAFGTGALKITPAHDPNDFELGRRHALPEIDVLDDEARINSNGGPYAGLDRYAARKKVVADLEAQGLLEKIEPHTSAVGLCQRCHTVVEPRLSEQWFCKMKPLAERAIGVVREGLIKILPENQEAIYLHWMENIRDWCISRQLWWGHRIPVWHCADCQAMTPARDSRVEMVGGRAQAASPPLKCGKCGSAKLTQDADVLDTWFSSGLWPFSTLGWPDDTPDLRAFYPTTLMINGFDILFFWDARMIMFGLKLLPRATEAERIPFRNLYIHALVRDAQGEKMSKMKGNVADPLALIEQYGTDATRFALTVQASPGTDILLKEERFLSAQAFANKIWNAARFLFFNLEKSGLANSFAELAGPEVRAGAPYGAGGELGLADRWIYSRLSAVSEEIGEALERFEFHHASHLAYHFFWHEFCDWYIEWVKPQLTPAQNADRAAAVAAWRNLFAVFEASLRLLHPFMPFLSEELWHKLPQQARAKSIALEPFPAPRSQWHDAEAERDMAQLQEVITAARNIRAEAKVEAKKPVAADFSATSAATRALVTANLDAILRLATLSTLHFLQGHLPSDGGVVRSTAVFDLRIAFSESVDVAAQAAKLRKERDRLAKDIESKRVRLGDSAFRSKAPEHVVRSMESTLLEREAELKKLADRLAQLEKQAGSGAPA
jgi:valyl-tRNA synthetase